MKDKLFKAKVILTSLGLGSAACDIEKLIKMAVDRMDSEKGDAIHEMYGPIRMFDYVFQEGDSISDIRKYYSLSSSDEICNDKGEAISSASVGETISIPLFDTMLTKSKKEVYFKRSNYNVELIAATLYYEAAVAGKSGMTNVFQVIKNRAGISSARLSDSDYEKLVRICLEPKQFSCWNGAENKKTKILQVISRGSSVKWNEASEIISKNETSAEVGKSTFYIAKYLWDQFSNNRQEAIKSGDIDLKNESRNQKSWLDCFEQIYEDDYHKFGVWKDSCHPEY